MPEVLRTLVLVTRNFPYFPGEEFLEGEVPYLADAFDRLILVPQAMRGAPRDLPPKVQVETSLAERLSTPIRQNVGIFFRSPLALVGCLGRVLACRPQRLRVALGNLYSILASEAWFKALLDERGGRRETMLVYHYWTSPALIGTKQATAGRRQVAGVVSRAHGGDLYEEVRGDHDWPFRERVMTSVDRMFLVSEHGRAYLTGRRPWMASKSEVARLGVADHGETGGMPQAGRIVVCSCSGLIPIKRIDLLVRALAVFGVRFPGCEVEWHHIGDGPLRSEMEALASACLRGNLRYVFHGQLANDQVRTFYLEQFIDAFVNISRSEGVPVSIMEAQSAGIPVIATAVGGTPELVNSGNGLLLPPDVTEEQMAGALADVMENRAAWVQRRSASRRTWASMSDAGRNYGQFAQRLLEMCAVRES